MLGKLSRIHKSITDTSWRKGSHFANLPTGYIEMSSAVLTN